MKALVLPHHDFFRLILFSKQHAAYNRYQDMKLLNEASAKLGKLQESTLVFYLNGTRVELQSPDPDITLLEYLRHIGLRGTKLGCGEGRCGACTVMISAYDTNVNTTRHIAVNSCLLPICALDGNMCSEHPHPIQERMARMHATQCGFCTPGMVLSLYSLLRNNPSPSEREIEDAFDGNLCRCTGYRSILDAAKTIRGCGIANCCMLQNSADDIVELTGIAKLDLKEYNASQEIIFPPGLVHHLKDSNNNGSLRRLEFVGKKTTWYRPSSLEELLKLKTSHPEATLIAGGTKLEVKRQTAFKVYPILIQIDGISELNQTIDNDNGVEIGANKTLAELQSILINIKAKHSPQSTESYNAILETLKWTANNQIRNVGTIGGNIANMSSSSSLLPVLAAVGGTVTTISVDGKKEKVNVMDIVNSGKVSCLSNDIIVSIHVPLSLAGEHIRVYRQAQRKQNSGAILNAVMGMKVDKADDGSARILQCTMIYGDIQSKILVAKNGSTALANVTLGNRKSFENAVSILMGQDLNQLEPDNTDLLKYQLSLANSFVFRFWNDICHHYGVLPLEDESSVHEIYRGYSHGQQQYEDTREFKSVGKPFEHANALMHSTGEAVYIDDTPSISNEVFGAPVLTTVAHGKIKSIDASEALAQPGVVDFITSKDVPGAKVWGVMYPEEEIFVSEQVNCIGQIIGLIIAGDRKVARSAARLVKVEYEEQPAIISIEDAIAKESFFEHKPEIARGDLDAGFAAADHIFEGEQSLGGQEHFYMETHSCIAIPKGENGEMEIIGSTQGPSDVQRNVSQALNVPKSRIVVRVKRMGGAFGGKESRGIPNCLVTAVAARKLKRPVRFILTREEDMVLTGKRPNFLCRWKVGVTKEGKITAYQLKIYANSGLFMFITQCDNAYYFPAFHANGFLCKTNVASNTAFRGFGGPEGMFTTESVIHAIADRLAMPVEQIQEINFYKEGQLTPYNQQILDWNVSLMWQRVNDLFKVDKRRTQIKEFNDKSRWKKRGIAAVPVKFGVTIAPMFHCQGSALIHIHTDGSVLLTHGGVEMGQGLHTKMIQICAEGLDIPTSSIFISETATDKIINAAPTAGSISNACDQLRARLQPYRERQPNATFAEIATMAYSKQVNLSAHGFYKTRELGFNKETGYEQRFFYYTQGVGVSEVEVDVLTGDHVIVRTDIIMDIGDSLNYALDIGQIEGGFTQGVGLLTMEEVSFRSDGYLMTRNANTYKVPAAGDIPRNLQVHILKDGVHKHLDTVYRSKGIGEPPVFIGASVFFAIREAIKSARRDAGQTEPFTLTSPATAQRIQLMCAHK
ncbi:putative xanthine dehydrogenase HxA [Syncephalis fuscata]|nr:putative xanthine dehydrogenase HxA [Syncephalis fuscata]